jgi:mannose-6-phosphate isomerase-like protein (cupin superfamily)
MVTNVTRMMRFMGNLGLFLGLVTTLEAQGGPAEAVSYAPKATKLTVYNPPHKAHTRLSDVKAKHKGEREWSEWVVKDEYLWSQYVQSAPGSKVSPRFHPDTREWWVILEGQIRFVIEGQDPFVAGKRSMVQVPAQTIYSMETIGDRPALRFETNIANVSTLFPEPPKISKPGIDFIPVLLGRTPYPYGFGNTKENRFHTPNTVFEQENRPHINLSELASANPNYRGGHWVHDDVALADVLYGYASKLPPLNEKDRGHYHPECSEYWLIMEGQIRYAIEGQGVIIASEGDVVYAAKSTFHAPRFWGEGPSCRLAMHAYYPIAHLREPGPRR